MDDSMNRPAHRAFHAIGSLLIGMAICLASNVVHAEVKVHVVTIEAMRYVPEVIEVRPGDMVVWQNKDAFPHTASASDRSFDSGSIASEGTWKLKARRKGSFPYVCTLHPTMKATLIVK